MPNSDLRQVIAVALRDQMPNLKTQAQFEAFMASFDAFYLLMDAVFEGNVSRVQERRNVFNKAIEAAEKVTDIVGKFQDVPEAAGPGSEIFTTPPKEYGEASLSQELLNELASIQTPGELADWYTSNRSKLDKIVSKVYRDPLFDAIRAKRASM